jgi:hypothetical protein
MTRAIIAEYGNLKMAEGGEVPGDSEKTNLHKTFAGIFKVPAVFRAILAGKDGESETNVSGFGADSFDGMVPRMMGALRESAYEQSKAIWENVPYGWLLAEAQRLMNKPIDEIHDIMSDNAVTQWISENLGSDVAKALTASPLTDAIDEEINRIIDDVNGHIRRFLGLKKGGVVGMVEPGEMRLSKNALQAIAGGINSSRNVDQIQIQPGSRSVSTTSTKTIIGVEIDIAPGAIDFITAKQREKTILGI